MPDVVWYKKKIALNFQKMEAARKRGDTQAINKYSLEYKNYLEGYERIKDDT